MRLFADIWEYRQALWNFVLRDLTVRYKRSFFGFIWSFLNPLMLILTFWVLFTHIMPVKEPNYSVMLFCTMLPWRFFNQAVMDGSTSVGAKLALIKRVNFPRIILPAASLMANFIDFLLSLTILAVYFAVVRVTLDWPYMALVMTALLIQIIFIFGFSLIVSSLSVFFTDVQFLVGSLFQMWFFLTPVLYPAQRAVGSHFPPLFKILYFLNPIAPLMIAYRSIIPAEPPHTNIPTKILTGATLPGYYTFLGISALVAIAVLIIGVAMFKRWEPRFAKEG